MKTHICKSVTAKSAIRTPDETAAQARDCEDSRQRSDSPLPAMSKLSRSSIDLAQMPLSTRGGPGHGGLEPRLKAGIEHLSGVSLDGVQVHRNSLEPGRIGAAAFARGRDIHLGPGQERHLPHEAWHLVQQAKGQVRATGLSQGKPINDEIALEREADVMGERARAYGGSAFDQPASALSRGAMSNLTVASGADGAQGAETALDSGSQIVQLTKWLFKNGRWNILHPTVARPRYPNFTGDEGQIYDDDPGFDYEDATLARPPSPYTTYKQTAKSKYRERAEEIAFDEDSDDDEMEIRQDTHFFAALDQLFQLSKPMPDAVTTEMKALSDQVQKEISDDDLLSRDTFYKVAAMHNRPEAPRVSGNPILQRAHRRQRKGKGRGSAKDYGNYRSSMNTAIVKVAQEEVKKRGFTDADLDTHLSKDAAESYRRSAKLGKLDLKDDVSSRAPAFEHRMNKGGPQGFSAGGVRSNNFVVVNDARKGSSIPHPMWHSVKAAEGGDKQNFSRFDDHVAMAVAAGNVGYTAGAPMTWKEFEDFSNPVFTVGKSAQPSVRRSKRLRKKKGT